MARRKTALVTGSTSGIGQGIAAALAGHGMNVVLNGMGRHHRHQFVGVVPWHPCGAPGDETQGVGADLVNIASAHALVASPYEAAYVAAKHGVAGLTKTVRSRRRSRASPAMRSVPAM